MRTRFSMAIPAVALAAALAACGDSGPSKSDFTAKADGSCAAGNTAISSAPKPTNAPQVVTAAGTAVSTVDGQVAMLRAMKTPGGKEKAQVEGVIAAIGEVSVPTKALQDAAGKNDDAAMVKAGAEMQAKIDAAATSAQAYGLTQCGTGLKPAMANLFEGTKSVVKSSYVTKAAALCLDFERKSNRLAPPGSSLASLGRYLDAMIPLSVKLADDIRAIPVPPGDEGTVAEFLAAIDSLNVKSKEAGAAAKANNVRLLGALAQELDVAGTAINAKLDAYGLKTCGTVGG